MRPSLLLLAATALLFAPAFAHAEPFELVLDPDETRISFSLGATLHTVHGTARLTEGRIDFDPETGSASGQIVVDATSADTESPRRDRDMHKKVLRSMEFPQIVLELQSLQGSWLPEGESSVTLGASITLLGKSHELTIPVTTTVEGDRVSARLAFTVPYVEWGLKNPSNLVLRVAKVVEVTVEASGTLTTSASEAATTEDS